MTIIASDDFEGYADLDALSAVWTQHDGVHDYNHVTLGGGGGVATVDVNTAYSAQYGFSRVFDSGDGILPNTTYTVSATATGSGACTQGAVSAASSPASTTTFGDPGTKTFSVTATSNAAGELYVFIGFTFTPLGYWDYVATMSFASVEIDDGVPAPVFLSALPVIGVDWDTIAYTAGVMRQGDVVVGLTRGALRFDPGETWQVQEYDGNFVGIVGSQELVAQRPRFIGSFLPVGPRNLRLYLPASSQSGTQESVTVTPTVPAHVLAQGEYSQNLSVTWPLLDGGTITVTFPYAFWQHYEFTPENKGELLVPCEILGVPLTATTAPYYITVTEPGTFS